MDISDDQLIEAEWRIYASVKETSLVQMVAYRLVRAKPLSEASVDLTLRNQLQWNLNRNSYIFTQENAIENVIWKMTTVFVSASMC